MAGDSFADIAVPLLVLRATGSVAQMGLLTGAAGVAAVAAGLAAGVVADRLDRRALLIGCDLARMVLYGLVPVAWALRPEVWLLYAVLPAGAAIGMVFQVTYVTAVRNLVDGDRITEANGRLFASASAVSVAGPLLAGLISGTLGPTAAIGIDAASFGVSAAGAWLIRLRGPSAQSLTGGSGGVVPPRQTPPAAAEPRSRPLTEFLAGARFLWRHPVLRSLTMLLSGYIFLTYGLTNVLIYYLRHDLHQSYAAVGVVLSIGAAGTVGGALLAAPIRRKAGFGAAWIVPVALGGVAVAGLGASRSLPVIAALAAVYLAGESVGGICSMSLRQEVTPDHLLGRVTSAFWVTHFSLGPVGAVLLAWGAGRYGVAPVCVAAGAGCVLIAAIALFTPVRQRGPEPTAGAA